MIGRAYVLTVVADAWERYPENCDLLPELYRRTHASICSSMSALQIPKQILEYLVGREYLIQYFLQILQYLIQILEYLL